MNGWISVKERLPEEDQIIIIVGRGQPLIAKYRLRKFERWTDATLQEIKERPYIIQYPRESVTHWQPLPAPPKQEQEGGD